MYTLELTETELRFAHRLIEAWLNDEMEDVKSGGGTNLHGKICEQLKKSTAK